MAELEQTKEMVKKVPMEEIARQTQDQKSLFLNLVLFEHGQRVAKVLADSTMVPEHFRGNIGNCMIALNYAMRIGADPLMAMQSMYIVSGKPGIEAKLVMALINQSGKYSEPLRFEWVGANEEEVTAAIVIKKKEGPYGCRAVARDTKSGKWVKGPTVTWEVAKDEGWFGKSGSKWKTIPEMMFIYRAASWFANIHCPEVKLGMMTTDEIADLAPDMISLTPEKEPPRIAPEDAMKAFRASEPIGTDKKALAEFMDLTANANRSTVDELEIAASKDLDGFWEAFRKWEEKRKPEEKKDAAGPQDGTQEQKTEETAGKPETQDKQGKKEKGTKDLFFNCPPNGERPGKQVSTMYCGTTCPAREGCPARA